MVCAHDDWLTLQEVDGRGLVGHTDPQQTKGDYAQGQAKKRWRFLHSCLRKHTGLLSTRCSFGIR